MSEAIKKIYVGGAVTTMLATDEIVLNIHAKARLQSMTLTNFAALFNTLLTSVAWANVSAKPTPITDLATKRLTGLSTFADNAAALAGGKVAGDLYVTATGVLMVTFAAE
jgi:hypothetical protein